VRAAREIPDDVPGPDRERLTLEMHLSGPADDDVIFLVLGAMRMHADLRACGKNGEINEIASRLQTATQDTNGRDLADTSVRDDLTKIAAIEGEILARERAFFASRRVDISSRSRVKMGRSSLPCQPLYSSKGCGSKR
jgi:hypothetical protein